MADSLFLHAGAGSLTVRVHPAVLFQISDHHSRRNEGDERVIGALLGSAPEDGMVEVRDCFPVPMQTRGDKVLLDINLHDAQQSLHKRLRPNDSIVGWYSTGEDILDQDVVIHGFFATKCSRPVLLKVGADLKKGRIPMKAYSSTTFSVAAHSLSSQFRRVRLDIAENTSERIAIDILQKWLNASDKQPEITLNTLTSLEDAIVKLRELLAAACEYVKNVVDGKIPADTKVGQVLSEAVHEMPKFDPATYQTMFQGALQDQMLVAYLASLAKAQLSLSEKIQSL